MKTSRYLLLPVIAFTALAFSKVDTQLDLPFSRIEKFNTTALPEEGQTSTILPDLSTLLKK